MSGCNRSAIKSGLLHCPFCGKNKAQLKKSPRWGWFVSCQCTAVGPGKDSKEGAIEAWNTRLEPEQGRLDL